MSLPKIRDTSKKLRRVKPRKIVEALGAELDDGIERTIHLNAKDAKKFLSLLNNPPKPNKRLKDAAKRYKKALAQLQPLPMAPEICSECIDENHVMHVVDELGELYVGSVGTHFYIHGHAEAGDYFWLGRILKMAYEAVASLDHDGKRFSLTSGEDK